MSRFRSSIPKELLSLGALGVIGIIYAVFASTWHNISFVATMTLLVLIIELFPIRVSKMNFTCSFPVLYTMAITSNYATVVLLSVISIIVSHLIQRRPVRILLLNAATRVIALLATNFVIRGINFLLHIPSHPPIRYYFFNLFVAVVVFSAITYYLVMKYVVRRLSSPSLQPIIFKWSILNIVISYLYVSFMLWLASDPKNTGSGTLGTVFFFIPLVALTIVMHLITGLTRAKSGLETLFTVSQSINQQRDLPTVLRHIISEASRLVHGDCGFLYLVQESGELVRMVGTLDDERVERRHSPGNGLVGTVAQTGEPLMIHDVSRDARFSPKATLPDMRSLLIVPILIDDNVAGVISLGKKETHSYHEDDLKLMTIFATHASVAMKNAMYIEEREKRLLLEERNRLAREIHDGLAQDLASTLLQIEMMKRTAEPHQQAAFNELQQALRTTSSTVRHSIYSLRPQPYSHVGLVPAIRAHLEEATAQTSIRPHLEVSLLTESLPPAISKAVFEIVTEGVQNAVKHADARDLYVSLEQEVDLVRLVISDNGKGFHFGQAILSAEARKSFGIENLHNIADQAGGSLDFLTAPGQGTTITLEIPLEEADRP